MISLLDVNSVIFTFSGYSMSFIEFFGTILNIICVWLVAKQNILTWPIGIVASVLFGFLFFQIQLYSDLFEQIFYVVTGFIGWWFWWRPRSKKKGKKSEFKISYSSKRRNILYLAIISISTIILSDWIGKIHLYLPDYFPVAASYPFLDSLTTVMSFTAQILMTKKKIECWYLWIAVDIIGIGLYFAKGVVFVSLLYFIFLILASKGLLNWRKIYQNSQLSK